MPTLYKYSFNCTTESLEKSVWRAEDEAVPSKCPDDTSHTIDTNSIRITQKVSDNLVQVQEESTPTGGHFKSISKSIDILANETKFDDNVWDFNISALEIEFISTADNQGDNLELIVGQNTVVGVITSDVSVSDNVINASQTVIDNIFVGSKVNLFDGVNTEDLGYVIAVDKDNKTITTKNSSTQAFSMATPTYIRMSVYVIENYVIGPAGRHTIGGSKIGGSFIPKNTIVRIVYQNNSGSPKNFTAQLDYLY